MYQYTHIEPEIKTISSLLTRKDVKLFKGITSAQQFLSFKNPKTGTLDENKVPIIPLTNWDRLKLKLKAKSEEFYRENLKRYETGAFGLIEIPNNTTFYIPDNFVLRDSSVISQDKTIVKATTLKAFMAKELNDLFQNPDYRQTIEEGSLGANIVSNREVTAYMWVRAAGTDESGGEWINISAFIHNQTTFVGENGGNFTIDIAPIVAGFKNGVWSLDDGSIQGITSANFNDTYSATSFIHKQEDKLLKRNQFFFHTAIQANDLIYIKFEDLEKDLKIRSLGSSFILSPEEVARRDWDMIGMVDVVPQVVNSVDNNILIRITGRDLIKALIDDECVFFPENFRGSIFGNLGVKGNDKIVKRLFGKLIDFNTYTQTSIEFNLKFVLNQLSETGYVSNNAFSGYNKEDLSQIHRNVVSLNIKDFKSFGSAKDFNTSDVGASINQSFVTKPELTESDGIWKIVKLIVDKSVRERRVVDNSIFASQGSLLNFMRKVCQAPLVEMMTDTYGKQFYITARKPPFDRNALTSLVYDIEVVTDDGNDYAAIAKNYDKGGKYVKIVEGKKEILEKAKDLTTLNFIEDKVSISNLTLSIDESVVLNENLTYDTRVYSWYSYNPKGLLNGVRNDSAWSLLRAVKFNEYVDVWGSKPLQLVSNYTRFHDFSDAKSKTTILQYETQALHDLKYIVESHAYLPFTRKGQITIHGDARFKRGMFMYYLPTNEIFYIDAVQQRRDINNTSVDRTTVLTVSRGMVEPYIRGVNGYSYFDIIKLNAPNLVGLSEANKILSTWKVNPDVFNFFLNRRQWVDSKLLSAQGLGNAAANLLSDFDVKDTLNVFNR